MCGYSIVHTLFRLLRKLFSQAEAFSNTVQLCAVAVSVAMASVPCRYRSVPSLEVHFGVQDASCKLAEALDRSFNLCMLHAVRLNV